jgi:hypothetical protein
MTVTSPVYVVQLMPHGVRLAHHYQECFRVAIPEDWDEILSCVIQTRETIRFLLTQPPLREARAGSTGPMSAAVSFAFLPSTRRRCTRR